MKSQYVVVVLLCAVLGRNVLCSQYQVYQKLNEFGWLEKKVEVNTMDEMEENNIILSGLEYNRDYVVRVMAENAYGRSDPGNVYKRRVQRKY